METRETAAQELSHTRGFKATSMNAKKITYKKPKKSRTKGIIKPVDNEESQVIKNSTSSRKRKCALKTSNDTSALSINSEKTIGMPSVEAGAFLLEQVISCLPEKIRDNDRFIDIAITMLLGIDPKDELEGMLVVQMVAVHLISMNMSGRCMLDGQTVDGVNANVNRMTKLMRTFTNQVEALQKYRGKGKQTITVQHVQVNEGGQAVVGNVLGGGSNG